MTENNAVDTYIEIWKFGSTGIYYRGIWRLLSFTHVNTVKYQESLPSNKSDADPKQYSITS